MKSIPKLLSKTKLMRGYRCEKCIYLTIHHPEQEAPITPELQALFDQGNAVGKAARDYFPNGVLIDNKPWDFIGAIAKTRELIATGTTTIYEAAFEYMGCYARADIIQFSTETKRWSIYEVKSTTKVKPEHLDDIALQTWIMTKSGLPVEKIHLMHLNTECRYPDLSNLFATHDVTAEMREHYLTVQPKIRDIYATIRQPTIPSTDIGPHCLAPTECGFKEHCWTEKNIPDVSIFDLPGLRDRKWDLYREGIIALDDSRLADLNEMQERIINVTKSNERFINREAIAASISTWQFPLVFLDFETINPAIPRYIDCGPFQQVPFQFSAHVWVTENSEITHQAYLHETADDPRPLLIPALVKACGTQGSIIAYYSTFEATRIKELSLYASTHLPQYVDALNQLIERLVDPLPIIREAVYDAKFGASFSLKKVAPALLGERFQYDAMEVANGGEAQRAFEKLIASNTPPLLKQKIRAAMLEYCNQDTWVMVELVKWLMNLITDSKLEGKITCK